MNDRVSMLARLKGTRLWRWTNFPRRVVRSLLPSPRIRVGLNFRAVSDLVVLERHPDHVVFEMTGNDPYFLVSLPRAMRVLPGRYKLFVTFPEGLSGLRQPRLYMNAGQGYSESLATDLRFTKLGDGKFVADIMLPRGVRGLRFDPAHRKGRLAIGAVVLQRVGRATGLGLARQQSLADDPAGTSHYREWLGVWHDITRADRQLMQRKARGFARRPLISVLMPTYNTPEALLRGAIESVIAQTYDNWELCIADDASTDPRVREVLREYERRNPRVKVCYREENGHISRASNSALDLVSGEWTALLDHDDLLAPQALYCVADAINRNPSAELIYSDEDKIDEAGQRSTPFFKPDFSPELFLSQNYLNHLTVHRTENVRVAGGWRVGFEGSQDYDLSLRILERIPRDSVVHVPQILYHWRLSAGSTALAGGEKDYAYSAGLRALEEHVERLDLPASVEPVPNLPYYRVRYRVPEPAPLVSILIPTRDRVDILSLCISSLLENSTYPRFEILIVDNGSELEETRGYFDEISKDERVRVLPFDHPFNYSAINNFAAREAKGDVLLLLNNDIEVITPDWLEEMVSWAIQPEIGCVGAKLYYPNDLVQHVGVVLGIGGVAGHSHKYLPRANPGYFSRVSLVHPVSAVTAACLAVRREVFHEVGGLDEENLKIAFNDVDFCLKVREAGYRNLVTPFAELYHHESLSRGAEDSPEKQERFSREMDFMIAKWGTLLERDPYYSPNLTLERENYGLAEEPRVIAPWRRVEAEEPFRAGGEA